MPEVQYPGVYIAELSSSPRSISGVPTSISTVVGADVLARLQGLVEKVPQDWDDDNQSDPAIALLELLAWLAETLAFRASQTPELGTLVAARLAAASLALVNDCHQPEGSPLKRVRCFEGPILDDDDNDDALDANDGKAEPGHCLKLVRTTSRFDPYKNFNFRISVRGTVVAGFQEIDGLHPATETGTLIDRAAARLRKLLGLRKYPVLTLKRGYVGDRTLTDWYNDVRAGRVARRMIVVKQTTPVRSTHWCFANAWPKKLKPHGFQAAANEVSIESMELAHDGIEIDTP